MRTGLLTIIYHHILLAILVIDQIIIFANGDDSTVTNFSDVLCGQRTSKYGRIVGGMMTPSGEFPWIVSIKKQTSHNCGGVVVNKRWVVTAAHCFCSGSSYLAKEKFSISISRTGYRNTSAQDIKISKVMLHPEYSCQRLENDIALLRLKVDISWINADPACFPAPGQTGLKNVPAIAAGWGATNEDLSLGTIPVMLHQVEVPILENDECQRWYRSQNKSLSLQKSQMCAGFQDGKKDTCWADSGGPLMVKNGANMVVVGIVSTGIGCARASLPGIYTRLTAYIDWMTNSIS